MSALPAALHRFDPAWIKVGRICRRIGLLRSEGRTAEAGQLEDTDFADAVAEARRSAASESAADATLEQVIAEEQARVADALALAEILVPLLTDRLALPAAAHPPPVPRRAHLAAPAEVRGIADFIDDMLRQERNANA